MFDANKATLRPESDLKLNAVLAILKEYPAVKLRIGGYTDSDGHEAANLKLSGERANACKLWFINKGIRPERLEAEGYGEQHPVAPNDSPENKAKNRRISFSVREK
jgi:K(+)-stimulated pyrophosphate-energized sodium pump